ncbi:hypothetical protein GCM10027563_39910 [Parasphingorhabdus pacifica]
MVFPTVAAGAPTCVVLQLCLIWSGICQTSHAHCENTPSASVGRWRRAPVSKGERGAVALNRPRYGERYPGREFAAPGVPTVRAGGLARTVYRTVTANGDRRDTARVYKSGV